MTDGDITITGTGSFTTIRNEGIIVDKAGDLTIGGNVTLDLSQVGTSIFVREGDLTIEGNAHIQGKDISSWTGNVNISQESKRENALMPYRLAIGVIRFLTSSME